MQEQYERQVQPGKQETYERHVQPCKQEIYDRQPQFERTELLIGAEGMRRLRDAHVAVFGIGGVGGYVVEALARSGVGRLDLIDNDTVALSNLNRQIIATMQTVGQYKVDVAKARVLSINPEAEVRAYRTFYLPETAAQFDFSQYDYVVDAIDTVTGKLQLAEAAKEAGVPIISSMGAGNKMDAAAFQVADISETSVCPLAKVMRRELKKRRIKRLKVVYSKEMPMTPTAPSKEKFDEVEEKVQPQKHSGKVCAEEENGITGQNSGRRRQTPGSNAFVPPVVGLIIAGEVVKDLIKNQGGKRDDIAEVPISF